MKYLETDLGVITVFMMKYLEWNSFKHTVTLKSFLSKNFKRAKTFKKIHTHLENLYYC